MKKNLVLLFGGKSAEHDISIRSAHTIYQHLNKEEYNVYLVAITRKGLWYIQKPSIFNQSPVKLDLTQSVVLTNVEGQPRLILIGQEDQPPIDVVFPITHGPNGEDGTLQGFLTLLNLPFVGPDTLSSACAMDKEVAKILLNAYGLNTAQALVLHYHKHCQNPYTYSFLSSQLGETLYIKPANMGSSVGVSCVKSEEELQTALKEAYLYDSKVLAERAIVGREIECAVLGNKEEVSTSTIGEILPKSFYSYEAKYSSDSDTALVVPANLDDDTIKKVQKAATQAYLALQCEGMARVDFFLQADGKLIVNEANTLPGFTSISMYPSLWAKSGLALPALLNRLLDLAFLRFERNLKLNRTYK